MAMKAGDRAGAIQSATKTSAKLFGYGTYDGDHPCPKLRDIPNPRITLDDDRGVVWGMECWWGGEDQVKEYIEGLEVTLVEPS